MKIERSEFDEKDLIRKLDAWLLPRKRASESMHQLAEGAHTLTAATAARNRADAMARFAFACFAVGLFVIAIAIFMLTDGDRPSGLVTLFLSLVPLVGGAWHLDRANRENRQLAANLARLQTNEPSDEA